MRNRGQTEIEIRIINVDDRMQPWTSSRDEVG